jgi:hypothetical protein
MLYLTSAEVALDAATEQLAANNSAVLWLASGTGPDFSWVAIILSGGRYNLIPPFTSTFLVLPGGMARPKNTRLPREAVEYSGQTRTNPHRQALTVFGPLVKL